MVTIRHTKHIFVDEWGCFPFVEGDPSFCSVFIMCFTLPPWEEDCTGSKKQKSVEQLLYVEQISNHLSHQLWLKTNIACKTFYSS